MGDFNADEWTKLSVAGRIERCRIAAREAERDAKSAAPELRDFYWKLAAQWRLLSNEIERHGYGSSKEISSGINS